MGHPFRWPSKSLFNTQPCELEQQRRAGYWWRADRERRREEIHGTTFSIDKSTRQKAHQLGLEGSGRQGALMNAAGKTMNYAAACKSSFIKVFWKRSHFRTVTLSDFLFFWDSLFVWHFVIILAKKLPVWLHNQLNIFFFFFFLHKITNSDLQRNFIQTVCPMAALRFSEA